MKKRQVVLIAGIMSVITLIGCQNEADTTSNQEPKIKTITESSKAHTTPKGNTGVAGESISSRVVYEQKGTEHHFTYEVQNQSERDFTFKFNSGQRFDYVVRDAEGNKMFQLSDGKMNTMSLGEETLIPGDIFYHKALINASEVERLEKGSYEIEMWLTTSDGNTYNETYVFDVK